jgi:protein TonB
MFDILPETKRVRSKGTGIALTAALVIHVIFLSVVGVVNLMAVQPIEPPPIQVTFFSAAAPPPPPPPPPPRRPRPKPAEEAPKPQPVPEAQPSGPVQPVAVPEELPAAVDNAGDEGGDDYGVDGGVEGGIEGGVVGGVPGGVLGGVPGGANPEDPPLRVGGDVEPPEIVRQVQPRYPEVAKAARVQGLVILEAIINTEGQVEDVKVLRGHKLLEQAAIEAIYQWKFRPGRLNGKPVKVVFTLTVNFTLKG